MAGNFHQNPSLGTGWARIEPRVWKKSMVNVQEKKMLQLGHCIIKNKI
jgi:hypothetical protein